MRLLYNRRGHQTLRLIGIDTSGNVRTIIDETSETFVDYHGKLFLHHLEEE